MSTDLPKKEKAINGNIYEVSQLPMGKWLELEAVLLESIGPSFAEAINGFVPGEGIGGLDIKSVSRAIYQLSGKLSAGIQSKILDSLGDCSFCNGSFLSRKKMELHFPQNMRDLAPFIAFALEVQFADFFDGLVSVIPVSETAEIAKESQGD